MTYEKFDENSIKNEIIFYVDSGCTDHMVNKRYYFSQLLMLKEPVNISMAKDQTYLKGIGIGTIQVEHKIYGKMMKFKIQNVLYVSDLSRNLLSVKRLEPSNIKVVFEQGEIKLIRNTELIAQAYRKNLYEMKFSVVNNECLNIETQNKDAILWHNRYGHIGYSSLKKLKNYDTILGLNNFQINNIEFCESYVRGKMIRNTFQTRTKSKRPLEIIHTDICGPIQPTSHERGNYFITFIDGYSFSFAYT